MTRGQWRAFRDAGSSRKDCDGLLSAPQPNALINVGDARPAEALKRLEELISSEGREEWSKKARIAAVLGNCPKSVASFRSGQALAVACVPGSFVRHAGLNHWLNYIAVAKGVDAEPFPVDMADVLSWSLLFRCLGTYANYLSHLRGACCALGHEPPPVGHPAIRRAMGAVAKRMLFNPRCGAHSLGISLRVVLLRPKLAIQSTMLRNMVAADQGGRHSALWQVAYTWLLRLPSEASPVCVWLLWLGTHCVLQALPLCICEEEPPDGLRQAAIWREKDEVCVKLRSRKNLARGSGVLRRRCSCQGGSKSCPVHAMWKRHLQRLPPGTKPFAAISAAQALAKIREVLMSLRVSCMC